jgi:hypothetical protein
MGWASAGDIFDPVARELIAAGTSDEIVLRVCVKLIETLQGGDWDTEDESRDEFLENPTIVEAFRRRGVYPQCGEIAPAAPGQFHWCRVEVDTDGDHEGEHDDGRGHRWPADERGE